jgi:hypothetical protein
LSVTNAFPGGSAHLPAFGCHRFWRGGRFGGAASQPGSEFGNLGIQLLFLDFHSQNRSIDKLSRKFRRRHVARFTSILPSVML